MDTSQMIVANVFLFKNQLSIAYNINMLIIQEIHSWNGFKVAPDGALDAKMVIIGVKLQINVKE